MGGNGGSRESSSTKDRQDHHAELAEGGNMNKCPECHAIGINIVRTVLTGMPCPKRNVVDSFHCGACGFDGILQPEVVEASEESFPLAA